MTTPARLEYAPPPPPPPPAPRPPPSPPRARPPPPEGEFGVELLRARISPADTWMRWRGRDLFAIRAGKPPPPPPPKPELSATAQQKGRSRKERP
ncbi:MAG: hypothetical protein IPG56_13110 [Caulobacteraceae bacterium]|nr:hypothetical protein [Caulobacteraceae bacterium]